MFCFVFSFGRDYKHAAIAAVPASGLRAAVTRRLGERLIGLGGGGGGSGRTDNDSSLVAESPEGGEVGLVERWGWPALSGDPETPAAALPTSTPPAPQGLDLGRTEARLGCLTR